MGAGREGRAEEGAGAVAAGREAAEVPPSGRDKGAACGRAEPPSSLVGGGSRSRSSGRGGERGGELGVSVAAGEAVGGAVGRLGAFLGL